MGLLSAGKPMDWAESRQWHDYIRQHGILQFLHIYQIYKERTGDIFLWGDEVEMLLVDMSGSNIMTDSRQHITPEITQRIRRASGDVMMDERQIHPPTATNTSDNGLHPTQREQSKSMGSTLNGDSLTNQHSNGIVAAGTQHASRDAGTIVPRLSLRGHVILEQLASLKEGQPNPCRACPESGVYLPEYGKHMIEATPGTPYGSTPSHLVCVEKNMRYRRQQIESYLNLQHERLLTITAFPAMGTADSTCSLPTAAKDTLQPQPDTGRVTQSVYLADDVISPHPRFATLTRNIRLRRGSKVDIRVPLYQDVNTRKHIEAEVQQHPPHHSVPADVDHTKTIHMDAMGFGMGMACLQVTFQASNVSVARKLYDQLAVVAPLMMALTGATPFYRGRIADIDARWTVISQAVDCRTPAERGIHQKQFVSNENNNNSNQSPPTPRGSKSCGQSSHEVTDTHSGSDRSLATQATNAVNDDECCPPHVVMLPSFEVEPCQNHSQCKTPDVRCSATPDVQRIVQEERLLDKSTSTCCIPDNPTNVPFTFHRTQRVFKSRYDSISLYISDHSNFKQQYNDLPLEINGDSYNTLQAAGIDELLARHVAHLFIRDPLAIYSDRLALKDDETTEMFENLQSTNWQSVRFKPPPLGNQVGWRVEFRTMEVQLTDWENAAFTVFVSLLSRAILAYGINLYIPISKVDDNMRRAHDRDASRQQRFYWREDHHAHDNVKYREMSVGDVLNGTDKSHNCGLITLVHRYLVDEKMNDETRTVIDPYLDFISQRAANKLLTTATWLRTFVENHPLYQRDSIITPELSHDIVELCHFTTKGLVAAPDLLGKFNNLATGSDSKAQITLHVTDVQSVKEVHTWLKTAKQKHATAK